jgi:hypothetical protein
MLYSDPAVPAPVLINALRLMAPGSQPLSVLSHYFYLSLCCATSLCALSTPQLSSAPSVDRPFFPSPPFVILPVSCSSLPRLTRCRSRSTASPLAAPLALAWSWRTCPRVQARARRAPTNGDPQTETPGHPPSPALARAMLPLRNASFHKSAATSRVPSILSPGTRPDQTAPPSYRHS